MKIYVDKMPKATGQGVENQEELEIRMIFDGNKTADIELIHDHDKELIAKVLKEVEDSFTAYLPLKNRTGAWFYGRLNEILKKYQKEFEDGK